MYDNISSYYVTYKIVILFYINCIFNKTLYIVTLTIFTITRALDDYYGRSRGFQASCKITTQLKRNYGSVLLIILQCRGRCICWKFLHDKDNRCV